MEPRELVHNLGDRQREVRYSAGKALIALSASQPATVYPYFDAIAERLSGKDKIIRWNATQIVANLCGVDKQRRLDGVLDHILQPLQGPELVAAANTLGALSRIAAARPDLAETLAAAAIGARKARFRTPECRLIVIGHALKAVRELLPLLRDPEPALDFARSQRRATRPQVRAAARALIEAAEEVVAG